MDRLWAPWRINYIKAKKTKGCIFCQGKNKLAKRYVVFKTELSLAMLNIFPYNNGHMMVAPRRHVNDLALLKKEEVLDLFVALNKAKKLLDAVLKPQGYNIGLNLGEVSGAGILGHLHIHIVPRWMGDTNFMPATGSAKIIAQSISELYKQLRYANTKKD